MMLAFTRSRLIPLLAMASLAACATAPAPKPTLPPPPPPPPSEPHVEMAPIANPTQQREEPRHARTAPAESSAQKSAAPPPPPPAHPSSSNPLRAAQLRGAGLEQLNRGAINKAIALLKEASELDPGNALIRHDLDRALRIDKALHEKR